MRFSRVALVVLAGLVPGTHLAGQADDLPISRITLLDSLSFADQRQLLGLMKLKSPSLLGFGSTTFSRRALRVDALTIRNYYISRGFLEAQVSDSFSVLPEGQVDVYLRINKGRRYDLARVSITGNRLMTRDEIIDFLGVELGAPYNPVAIRNYLEALRHHYQNRGKLAVDILEEIEVEDGVHLRLTVSEGLTYTVGDVTIRGLSQVPEWSVRRELLFLKGDTFDRSKLLLSQKRIFESGMFGAVEVIPVVRASDPGVTDLEIRTRELKRRSIDLSLGFRQTPPPGEGEPNTALYGSVQFWLARVLNSSIRTGLTAEGDLILQDLNTPNFLLAWDIVTPWTFGLRVPTSVRLLSDYRSTAQRTVWERGIELSFTTKRLEQSRLRGAFGWIRIDATGELLEDETKDTEPRLTLDYRFQSVDNLLTPHRGTIFQLQPSLHGSFLPEVTGFGKLEIDFRHYSPFPLASVLAYRLKVSLLETWPPQRGQNLKTYHLFDLGGSTSLRGWEKPGDFAPLGGLAKALLNVELRVPLFWIIGSELFLDAGALRVFRTPDDPEHDPELPSLRWITGWDIGFGLLITTPLGPIRIDAAFPDPNLLGLVPTLQFAFLHTF